MREEEYIGKCEVLQQLMKRYTKENVVVAFSGGADSSLLLKLAVLYAGQSKKKVYAITADTQLHPVQDLQIARQVSEEAGAIHIVLEICGLEQTGIYNNPIDRCYRCKQYIFGKIKEQAVELEAAFVLEGTNMDDMQAYRPGIKAVEELGVKSPLREAGFTKEEVRRLAGEYGISVARRPSTPCLATRFPYGSSFDKEKLQKVEQGENYLRSLGFYNVRLRVHGEIARLEVDAAEMDRLFDRRTEITEYLKNLGYRYITADLEGFRSGSMDR